MAQGSGPANRCGPRGGLAEVRRTIEAACVELEAQNDDEAQRADAAATNVTPTGEALPAEPTVIAVGPSNEILPWDKHMLQIRQPEARNTHEKENPEAKKRGHMRVIKERLTDDITYGQIRMVLALRGLRCNADD
eukprot:gene9734-11536_t